MFFSSPLAQQVWHYATHIMWQLFAKRGNLGPHNFFFNDAMPLWSIFLWDIENF